jgi:riboflavin-specific deaminase-like protein
LRKGPASSSPRAFALYPPPSILVDPSDIHADLVLPRGAAGGRPYTVINAVSTLDGRAALEGKSSTIGSAADRVIMRNIRCAFDAVLVGAGTLRAENLDLAVPQAQAQRRRGKGLREQPLPIILMGCSTLPKERRLYDQQGLVILGPKSMRTAHLPADAAFRVLPERKSSGRVDIGGVLRILEKEFGVGLLLVEGGPTVNRSFLSGGHVDELFLTLAPRISGDGDAPNIVSGPKTLPDNVRETGLVSVHVVAGGELYLRYRLR